MTLQVYPTTPYPGFTYDYNEGFRTVVSEYQGENEQRQGIDRFGKRGFVLPYKVLDVSSEWYIIENFFHKRRGGLEPFWYFDFIQRSWVDEYVGRGGPYYVDGAVAEDNPAQVDETIYASDPTTSDMTLLPAVPAVNDAYYFGKKFMFDKLTLTISVQGVGTWTVVWYYWNGSAWTALSGVSDGTTGFTAAVGDRDVTFTLPSDWVDCEVKGRNLYWIMAKVTAYTSKTTIPKGSYAKVNTKTYDLHSKSTINDATCIAYIADVVTAKTFVSGGGGGGADRITFSGYPAVGSLITSDFLGKLRIKGVLNDKFGDKFISPQTTGVENINIREVWW